ncbi:MAG: transcriptional regulator, partial [Comamonadaceae bacterium]
EMALESLGLDVDGTRRARRRFACPCLDWSERRPHLGGALGAAWLQLALRRGWARQELDGRALTITPRAQRELPELFGPA